MNKNRARILRYVHLNTNCCIEAMVAADLRLSPQTVSQHVKALFRDGFVERGTDGVALASSAEGRFYLRLQEPSAISPGRRVSQRA